jgi:hypothetical protein
MQNITKGNRNEIQAKYIKYMRNLEVKESDELLIK